ncbi:MAG TPA: EamA family transporter [Chitinophagaceae bacterium]|nr:EamA family transporter [Chitinophagaceae bacterium]
MKQPPVKQYIYDIYDTVKTTVQPLHPKNQSEKTRALIALGLVSFFWGTTWLASKKGVEEMPGLQLAGIRQLLGGSVYTIYFLFKGYKFPTGQQLFQFIWMGILMFVISNGFTTWSLQYIPSGLGAVIGAMAPIWIAIFSVIFFRETKLNLTTVIGLLLGFGGIVIIFSDYVEALFNSKFALGVILGIIATMTWAIGTLYTVKHARDLNAYYSLGWQMFLSGLILTGAAWITGQHVPLAQTTHVTWLSIAYLVIVGSIITFAAFLYSLKRLPPAQASVYAYINPIVAVIIGSILNDEKLNIIIAAGTIVTILGVYLVNTGFKKAKLKEDN